MKTETFYRPINKNESQLFRNPKYFEPVTVHVGEFYLKRNDIIGGEYYEKVTHVLPMEEWKCPYCGSNEGTWFDRQLNINSKGEETMPTRCEKCGEDVDDVPKKETSDDYDYVLLKEGDEIQYSDQYLVNKNGMFEWVAPIANFIGTLITKANHPYRRKVLKSELQKEINELTLKIGDLIHDKLELQKKVEELEIQSGFDAHLIEKKCKDVEELESKAAKAMQDYETANYKAMRLEETIESQKREIESLGAANKISNENETKYLEEIKRTKSELAAFKADSKFANDIIFRQKADEISRLKKELNIELERATHYRDDWQNLAREIKDVKANLEQTKADLAQGKSELEEAKKSSDYWQEEARRYSANSDFWRSKTEEAKKREVKWEKTITDDYKGSYIDEQKQIIRAGDGKGMVCSIPLPPIPSTIDEQAEEAFEKYYSDNFHEKIAGLQHKGELSRCFKEGFKAAKEGVGE